VCGLIDNYKGILTLPELISNCKPGTFNIAINYKQQSSDSWHVCVICIFRKDTKNNKKRDNASNKDLTLLFFDPLGTEISESVQSIRNSNVCIRQLWLNKTHKPVQSNNNYGCIYYCAAFVKLQLFVYSKYGLGAAMAGGTDARRKVMYAFFS
jgi:hypothetical protein